MGGFRTRQSAYRHVFEENSKCALFSLGLVHWKKNRHLRPNFRKLWKARKVKDADHNALLRQIPNFEQDAHASANFNNWIHVFFMVHLKSDYYKSVNAPKFAKSVKSAQNCNSLPNCAFAPNSEVWAKCARNANFNDWIYVFLMIHMKSNYYKSANVPKFAKLVKSAQNYDCAFAQNSEIWTSCVAASNFDN